MNLLGMCSMLTHIVVQAKQKEIADHMKANTWFSLIKFDAYNFLVTSRSIKNLVPLNAQKSSPKYDLYMTLDSE
jgi:hypothetical protein